MALFDICHVEDEAAVPSYYLITRSLRFSLPKHSQTTSMRETTPVQSEEGRIGRECKTRGYVAANKRTCNMKERR